MMRGQVLSLLGHEGDPAQFRPFQFPPGCWLEISSIIGERVVSVQVKAPPEPQPPCAERARLLRAVSAAYIRALEGPTAEPEPEPEPESGVDARIDALCTWLEAVESWTHASALTLAWTGAVRIEARPTFTISVWRTLGASGPVTVEVTAEGSKAPAITTTVPTAAHTSHPTVRSVLDAFRDTGLTGLADMAKYEFSPDWDQRLAPWRREASLDDDGGLLLLSAEPSIITVTPRMRCALCNTYTLDARPAYIRHYHVGCEQYLDATNPCIDCAGSFGETGRALRLWGSEFILSVDGKHAPLFTLEFSAPVKVEVDVDSDAFDQGIGEPFYARAVPLASMSIWQHMAYLAGHAEDLLLRIAGAGPKQPEVPGSRKCPKLKSPLLGLLSEATIRKILAHLKRAVLPPSHRAIA